MSQRLAVIIVFFLLIGCSKKTPATDKAKAMGAKVQIVKAELVFGDPAEYGGHKHQQLKLTVKNNNADPVDMVIADVIFIDRNGYERNLPRTVLFAMDTDKGETPIPGFGIKEGIIGQSFMGENEIIGTSRIRVFEIKSIKPPMEAFKNQDHFMAFIAEKQ